MVDTSSSLQVLTAMITPAVLISACGTLIFSTSTRLSRVVDRVRSLAAQLQAEPTSEAEHAILQQNIMLEQLTSVARRVVLLRSAMTCFYIATGLFVATSIAVGVITITRLEYGWIAFVLALIGAGVLLIGSILLISEAQIAVTGTLQEMSQIREEIARRRK
jgi:hypothetical protein